MPRISYFHGIAIYMYWDESHHGRPDFHALYAGHDAPSRLSLSTPDCLASAAVDRVFHVAEVEVIAGYRLRLTFDDGTVGDVDFTGRAWHGVIEPLRDPSYFAQVRVDHDGGTIAWPNGVDMAPAPLYEKARSHPVGSGARAH